MSTDYRKLEPVEPIKVPSRFSMTMLQRDDVCPRSSYLGAKYRNGPSSHPLDRGTLFHASAERLMADLMRSGERQLSPEDPAGAASMTAAIVDEVLRGRPDLVVPRAEVDAVREMMFHVACGYDVEPESIGGLELLMVLDLDCGWTVSGRLDLISLPSGELGQVDDWKTSQAMPAQEEYEHSLQPWVYAVLLCFGSPVRFEDCANCGGVGHAWFGDPSSTTEVPCDVCDGKGQVEVRGEPFGHGLKGVLAREIYPRPRLRDDGTLHRREMLLARTAIADFRADLERQCAVLGERFVSWDFPARSGSWCSICPAPHECPLPEELRDYAGTINTREQAEEAWELALHAKARIAAVEREVKTYAKAHAVPIRVGDEQWEWEPSEGRALRKNGRGSDWDGLQSAVVDAVEWGKPFDVRDWVKPTVSNGFKKTRVMEGSR